ncbi:hypothetical protein M409DRAFT_68080 [Zasmidium cellare ATCC 36951]|uniref:Uncharacterized protein n=1 Tax=Zasmidium cellare ATCC 36951 TaxID=1080233 RepID=A0A6A6CAL5_ZASCE|nr:uncharacterized protein M409DRAFT_68080 [Zasmidium cellare ATCC 36951]KAF2164204.1 hypothetical protein M409DRAFT_68080 [Zasmidium cellare ATCC 36951]
MRRVTRKYLGLANIAFFAGALCLVLFINLGSSSQDRVFDWNTVRYKSAARSLPEARGACPGLSQTRKPALVISRVAADGDSAWLKPLEKKYHLCVYTVDDAKDRASYHLQVPANRGHEAMVFLTFLADNYENIPAAGAVFIHGARYQWHNDQPEYDNLDLLSSLNVSNALKPYGYHNLRCDWSASTCSAKESVPQRSLETVFKARLQPWDARAVSDVALSDALVTLFGGGKPNEQVLLGRFDAVRSQCCAQFVVSPQHIWQHSRAEYVALRQWLLDGGHGQGTAPLDDRVAGRIISYVWHILFMQDARSPISLDQLNAQACPSAPDCYCRLYGRCNLQGCTSGGCRGQYNLPPGFRLPAGFEKAHVGLT